LTSRALDALPGSCENGITQAGSRLRVSPVPGRQHVRFHAEHDPSRHHAGQEINASAVARSRKRTVLSELALVRDSRELRPRSKSSGCRMEFVFYGWRAESGGARLGRTEHSAPRCEAPPGSNSATTFQLPGIEPHTQKTLPRHSVCIHSRTPPSHSGRLSDSLDRAARPRFCARPVSFPTTLPMNKGKRH
jgi:hypothetical protein